MIRKTGRKVEHVTVNLRLRGLCSTHPLLKEKENNMRIRRERASATVVGIALLVVGLTSTPAPARAQAALPFSATYTGVANSTGPDASDNVFVTSTLSDPLASFGLTQALFTQVVNVFSNPNTIVGTSIFQTPGGAGNALFTSYSLLRHCDGH